MSSFFLPWRFLRNAALVAGALAVGAGPARAQQILCERVVQSPVTQNGSVVTDLLRLQPDSLRLLRDFQAGTGRSPQATRTDLLRLRVSNCDTLPVPGSASADVSIFYGSMATVTRRGQVLIATFQGYNPSQLVRIRLMDRDGRLRWARTQPPLGAYQEVTGLLEAPDRGFFVGLRTPQLSYLLRLDSLGTPLWQRVVSRNKNTGPMPFYSPTYTSAGTILMRGPYLQGGVYTLGVMEISQAGDSLATRSVSPEPQQVAQLTYPANGGIQPLRDGGFAVVGRVDSAGTTRWRPFLSRLDRQLNVVWSFMGRAASQRQDFRFSHPYELADGSLLVLVTNTDSGNHGPFWLYRLSAAGALLQRYAFASPLLAGLNVTSPTSFGPQFLPPAGLQPLSDSTFAVADNLNLYVNGRPTPSLYLAHLRVPGLPRVVDSHRIPPVGSALAQRVPADRGDGLGLPFPNPAGAVVHVPLGRRSSGAALVLEVCNVLGQSVLRQPVNRNSPEASLSVAELKPGMYLLRLVEGNQVVGKGRVVSVQH